MQVNIWHVAIAAGLSFVFGAGIAVLVDARILSHHRKVAKAYEDTLAMFQGACRATLSDAWFKKVLRRFRADFEQRMGGEHLT